MEPFARIVIGYHGCTTAFARDLRLGRQPIRDWRPSQNEWDWLGHGIYFWEHAPERALRWACERYRGRRHRPAVLDAYLQLGRCFDLLNEAVTILLSATHEKVARTFALTGRPLPENRGPEGKRRELDCLIINHCLRKLHQRGGVYDTVRGAFLEGAPVHPGAGFARESHPDRRPQLLLHSMEETVRFIALLEPGVDYVGYKIPEPLSSLTPRFEALLDALESVG